MSGKPKLSEFCAELVELHRHALQLGMPRSAELIERALFATLDRASIQDRGAAEIAADGACQRLH